MKKILLAVAIAGIMSTPASAAFFKYSYVSGFNRICIYDDMGSDVAITISSTSICPLTI